jgi:hypothetical protein
MWMMMMVDGGRPRHKNQQQKGDHRRLQKLAPNAFSPPRTPSYRNVTCCIHIHTVVRPCVVRLVGFYIVDSFADLWAIMDSAPSVYQELFLNSQQLCCIRIQ